MQNTIREIEDKMKRSYGSQSMVDPLRKVLVKRPDEAFVVDDPAKWHYTGQPNLKEAQNEHDLFVAILHKASVEVFYHNEFQPQRADAIFTHDPAIVTDHGSIILSMGKVLRRGEEVVMARRLEELGVPVLYTLHGEARAEGGDLLWVDHDTLAVGQGFRTNAEGLLQLKNALKGQGIEIIPVQLPYFSGPEACLHLMSVVSFVDHDLAVVYSPLLPISFWKFLKERGFEFIEVPDHEFATMGTIILTLTPKTCLMLENNSITVRRLEEAGCKVLTYKGNEISLKTESGPTCLTRPILREA